MPALFQVHIVAGKVGAIQLRLCGARPEPFSQERAC